MRLIRKNGPIGINKWFLFFLMFLLTGCLAPPLEDVRYLPAKEPVVFGRVKVMEGGQTMEWSGWDFLMGRSFTVHIVRDAGVEGMPYVYRMTGDGSFYWSLPLGEYIITEFEHDDGSRHVRRAVFARFVVPQAISPIYIGTLRIHSVASRYTMDVEDEYDQALQRLIEWFPNIKEPVTKHLMQLELP